MARKIWRVVEIVLMGVGLVALPILWMQHQDRELAHAAQPPYGVETFGDFRKWRPQYEQALKLESRGVAYYLVFGERARTLASGPSAYLFDARGNFVGWIRDSGDDRNLRLATDNDARKGAIRAGEIVIAPPAGAKP